MREIIKSSTGPEVVDASEFYSGEFAISDAVLIVEAAFARGLYVDVAEPSGKTKRNKRVYLSVWTSSANERHELELDVAAMKIGEVWAKDNKLKLKDPG